MVKPMKRKMPDRKMGRWIVILTFLLSGLAPLPAVAQWQPQDSLLGVALSTDVLLPAILDSATLHSPNVRRFEQNILLAKETQKINKKSLLQGVSISSSYAFGTAGNFSNTTSNTGGTNPALTFNTVQTSFYNLGAFVQIPLSNLLARRNLLRSGQYQIQMAESDWENTKTTVKLETTRFYMDLKLAHQLVRLGNDNKIAAYVNYSLAEKKFNQGELGIEEFSRVQETYNKAVLEFESALNRFQLAKLLLEQYAGINIAQLIRHTQ